MENLTFQVEDFEGPLDLLLHLVTIQKMNLYEIQIFDLIHQYLSIIQNMTDRQMEIASEFIEMAARFVYMKSVALLPKKEQAQQLQQELTGLLVEYALCKQVTQTLKEMHQPGYIAVRQPMELTKEFSQEVNQYQAQLLYDAYLAAAGKELQKKELKQDIFASLTVAPAINMRDCMEGIVNILKQQKYKTIEELFQPVQEKYQAVATFLALLELIRNGTITIDSQAQLKANRY